MRIIAGAYRRRQIYSPAEDMQTRPIPDRVRESVFGILRGHFDGAAVADFFAGTGIIGLEALSRGAASCVFVERDRDVAQMLKTNIDMLGCADRATLVIGDALGPGALARCPRPLKLAFLDPPYPLVRDVVGWARVKDQAAKLIDTLSPDGFLVLRLPHPFVHDAEDKPAETPSPARSPVIKRKRKGKERFDWRKDAAGATRRTRASEAPAPDEADIDETEHDTTEAAAPPRPPRVVPSLEIPGALGPETHLYGSMGVHLYARRPTH